MNRNKSDLIGIVLCGGESKRMKTDKALLEYSDKPQWKIVSEMLSDLCMEVVISVNEKQSEIWADNKDHRFITDSEKYKNHGPLSGILSIIDQFPDHSFLILGTDFPFIKTENLKLLTENRNRSFEAVCFKKDSFLQPLVSVIEKKAISKLKLFFTNGNDSLRKFLGEINTKVISADGEVFLENINTEEAFLALKK